MKTPTVKILTLSEVQAIRYKINDTYTVTTWGILPIFHNNYKWSITLKQHHYIVYL